MTIWTLWLLGGMAAAAVVWARAGGADDDPATKRLVAISGLLVLANALLLAIFPVQSDDLFIHLAVGRRFFATGHFPDPDPFLFSLTNYHRGWTDVWASHLLAFVLYGAGGFDALILAKAALVVVGAAAPLWLARRIGNTSPWVPAVLLLGVWAGSYRFLERASLVSDVASAWVLALCYAEGERPSRWRWVLPPLFAVWANLHTGALAGLGIVGAATLTSPRSMRRWVPLFLFCVAAACVHPEGARPLVWSLRGILGGGFEIYRRSYYEFMPTLAAVYRGSWQVLLYAALLGVGAAVIVRGWRRARNPWFSVLVFLAFAGLGLSSVRFLTTATFVIPVIVAATGVPAGRSRKATRWAAATVVAIALLLAVRVAGWGYRPLFGSRHLGFGVSPAAAPAQAADFVTALPHPGHIFNEHGYGAYLAWRWDGHPQIFFHGYVLDPGFYEHDYIAVNRSPEEFDRVVATYDIDVFFLKAVAASRRSGPLLHRLLLTRPDWALVYWDDDSMVFLRDTAQTQATVEALAYRWVDPWRPERLARGLREDPERVRAEARRVLELHPRSPRTLSLLRRALGAERPSSAVAPLR